MTDVIDSEPPVLTAEIADPESGPPVLEREVEEPAEKRPKVAPCGTRRLNKQSRMNGKPYKGFAKAGNNANNYTQSTPRPGRTMQPRCTSTFCDKSSKRKCSDVSDEVRAELFNTRPN